MPVYVRYLGTRACFTDEWGRFVFVDVDELGPDDRAACDAGGGTVTMPPAIYAALRWL